MTLFSLTKVTIAAALVGGTALPALANDQVKFALDWTPGGISAAYYLGLDKGCFTDQDIDVTISRGYGASDAVTKVATGVNDFSVTDLSSIIKGIAFTGAPVKAIMPVVSQNPSGVAVLTTSPIKKLTDLEGHSVGTSVGNSAYTYLPEAVAEEGGDFSKVKVTTADGSALYGLLLQGKIDALASYVTSDVGLRSLAKNVGKDVRSIYYGDELNIYNASVFTSDKMIKDNPGLVKRFAAAVECTYDAARNDPQAAVDSMVNHVQGMVKDNQLAMVSNSLNFAFDNAVFEKNGYAFDMDRVQHNIDMVNKVTPLDKTVTAADVAYNVNAD